MYIARDAVILIAAGARFAATPALFIPYPVVQRFS